MTLITTRTIAEVEEAAERDAYHWLSTYRDDAALSRRIARVDERLCSPLTRPHAAWERGWMRVLRAERKRRETATRQLSMTGD